MFGQCGYRLDGTRSSTSDNGFSPGKALMDLGYSEALVDRKRLLHAGSRTTSSESLLLRILMATNDVESLNDFGVSQFSQFFLKIEQRPIIPKSISDCSTTIEEKPKQFTKV